MLPIKEENIMISKYPVYNKKEVDEKSLKEVDEILEFVRIYRNLRSENNITNDYKVKLDNDNNYDLAIKLLKLDSHLIDKELNITSYKVKSGSYEATIYFEKTITEEDLLERQKEIEKLEASILRRKNLLSNENYVNKAPVHLVQEEKQKLSLEEEKLASLKS
jgi:valyl-tRNA synthetase